MAKERSLELKKTFDLNIIAKIKGGKINDDNDSSASIVPEDIVSKNLDPKKAVYRDILENIMEKKPNEPLTDEDVAKIDNMFTYKYQYLSSRIKGKFLAFIMSHLLLFYKVWELSKIKDLFKKIEEFILKTLKNRGVSEKKLDEIKAILDILSLLVLGSIAAYYAHTFTNDKGLTGLDCIIKLFSWSWNKFLIIIMCLTRTDINVNRPQEGKLYTISELLRFILFKKFTVIGIAVYWLDEIEKVVKILHDIMRLLFGSFDFWLFDDVWEPFRNTFLRWLLYLLRILKKKGIKNFLSWSIEQILEWVLRQIDRARGLGFLGEIKFPKIEPAFPYWEDKQTVDTDPDWKSGINPDNIVQYFVKKQNNCIKEEDDIVANFIVTLESSSNTPIAAIN